jgi:hypothetical protein
MWRLGADPEGYVANFVESEQIVQSAGYTTSCVQVSLQTMLFSDAIFSVLFNFSWASSLCN